MRSRGPLWLLAIGLLPFSGCVGPAEPGGAASEAEAHDHVHDHGDAGHAEGHSHAAHSFRVPMGFDPGSAPDLAHAPPFPLETGHRPSESEAKDFRDRYESVRVKGNEGLSKLRAEGYLHGAGTKDDPYVLERFYVDRDLSIESTDRAIVLRDGYVKGTLRLNYIGEDVYVHHVYATDLRINENVKRTGPNTGGLFHDDAFAVVGQIRHFVGEFRNNEVGPRPANGVQDAIGDAGVFAVPAGVVFNLDGFHTADIHDNKFVGSVLVKLHGHNHGDCFTCPVHDHSNATLDAERMAGHEHAYTDEHEMETLGLETHHSIRYSSLAFHDNEIQVPDGYALRYTDRNHAGDDRTANSEKNESLNDPHIHFQDLTFAHNRLVGGGFQMDVFNAKDEKHVVPSLGVLRFIGNEITVLHAPPGPLFAGARAVEGMNLNNGQGLELRVLDNHVRFVDERDAPADSAAADPLRAHVDLTGIELVGLQTANVTIAGNRIDSGTYGVYASQLAATTHWSLLHNTFQTEHAWRGNDVAEPPKEEP